MKGCPALTKPQINLALRHLKGRWRWRNRALLTLGIRTGLRISELLSLELGQVYQGGQVLPRLYLHRKIARASGPAAPSSYIPGPPPPSLNGSGRPWGRPSRTTRSSRASATRTGRWTGTPAG